MMNKASSWLVLMLACTGPANDDDKDTDTGEADADTDADSDTDTSDTGTEITVPTPVGDPATIELDGTCGLGERLGGFSVQMLEEYSTISGNIAEGVVPITVLEDVTPQPAPSDECKLLRRNNAFCDPPCDVGQTCDFDDGDPDDLGQCIAFPLNQDVGYVTIGGIVEPAVLHVVQPGATYFQRDTPHPAFDPGVLIELRTNGTTFGSDITLHGVGVDAIDLGNATDWTLFRDQDFIVTWEAPTASPSRGHVNVRLNIDQHGTTPVTLFCDFDDDGEGTIPGALITELIDFQVSGFPNATVTRRTVDSTTMASGCVEFAITSPTDPSVLVNGYIPCGGPGDCPPGQECNPVTFICE
jgi:hypothetical protein